MPDTTVRIPAWADPQQASVLDPWWKRTARMLGQVLGANDPTAQAMAIGAPVELPGGEASPAQKILKAFHGSPHDFDQFSLAKVGTGEGGQAYGHGLYFAENPAVAAEYRKNLAKGDALTVRLPGQKPLVGDAIDDIGLDAAKFLEMGKNQAGQFPHNTAYYAKKAADSAAAGLPGATARNEAVKARIAEWANAKIGYEPIKGATYEVNLHASPDELLDWDKPLSQQSPKVQEALKKAGLHRDYTIVDRSTANRPNFVIKDAQGNTVGASNTMEMAKANAEDWANGPGSQIYQDLVAPLGRAGHTEGLASQQLKDAGIKGIQYLDQGSRTAGQGTKNFVIFDDKIIEIAKKYGVALPVAAEIYRRQQQQIQGQSVNK